MTDMTPAQAAQQNNRDGGGKYATTELSEAELADLQAAGESFEGQYDSMAQCRVEGAHDTSVDDDGCCNFCGHQSPPFMAEYEEIGSWQELPSARLPAEDDLDLDDDEHAQAALARRSQMGLISLRSYCEAQNSNDEWETTMSDMVSDLRHAADRLGVDFDEVIRRSDRNYTEETSGEL